METIDKVKFELLLKQKYHKELIQLLTQILESLSVDNSTEVNSSMNDLMLVIKESNEKIPLAILSIVDVIVQKLEELKNKPKEKWIFKVTARDLAGNIDTVIAQEV